MPLTDKYGDLFVEILIKQNSLNQDFLEHQPVKQTLKLFRGFAQMDAKNWSEENKQGIYRVMETFIRSDLARK